MKRAVPFLLLPLGFLPAFAADIPGGGITPDHLSRHVRVLASDAFEGRAPATPGEEKTIAYVVDELKKAGVQPGGERGTWTQDVPLVRAPLASVWVWPSTFSDAETSPAERADVVLRLENPERPAEVLAH